MQKGRRLTAFAVPVALVAFIALVVIGGFLDTAGIPQHLWP